MNVKHLSLCGKSYTYVFVEQDEEVDIQKIAKENGDKSIVIIRNGGLPFKKSIVQILQYISDNPLT